MKRKKRVEWVDDGRVIANMDVDGIPNTLRRGVRRNYDAFGKKRVRSEPIDLTKKEKRAIAWGAASAYLLIFVVFAVLFGLILLLISRAWAN